MKLSTTFPLQWSHVPDWCPRPVTSNSYFPEPPGTPATLLTGTAVVDIRKDPVPREATSLSFPRVVHRQTLLISRRKWMVKRP
ncbi:hypothetical protein GDO86_020151 [Hymenochirus boettgeri]|uniref:Uncharacterized protein n=1 Tax=Hymenochirus boettgeri TaxID=247094 RepID=A0A8T2IMD2_9PIPI|nr:hypothetical protein GDO86_020151 [Hymenochirus boettgeri]